MPKKKTVSAPKKHLEKPQARERDETHPTVVEIVPAKCPKCGSANREWFHAVKSMDFAGYRIIWRNTRCTDCGQRYRCKERIPVRSPED